MKGIIFNLAEQVVVSLHGAEAWDKILEGAKVEGAYTAVGSYSDEEFKRIVAAAARLTNATPDDILRTVGRHSIPLLAQRYPEFFRQHKSCRTFLPTLNDVIHPEVRKLYPGAYAPSFEFETPSAKVLRLAYLSHRDMCAFAEGLILGAADHFRETVSISQPECTRRGGKRCVIQCTFG